MRNRVSRYGVCSLMVVALALGLITACASTGKAAALVVNPMEGKPKTAITISGSGFKPGEVIDITLETGPGIIHGLGTQKVDPVVADESGAFSVETGIPTVAPVGKFTIEAIGDKGSGATHPLVVTK
jgi:hypothetical protein